VIELKSADKHDALQWYTLYHQQDDTVTASSSITSAASLEVGSEPAEKPPYLPAGDLTYAQRPDARCEKNF